MGKLHVGSTHTVKIKGTWKINSGTEQIEEAEWTTTALASPFTSSPTAVMDDYGHMLVSGTLNASHGTTYVGTTANATWGNLSMLNPDVLTDKGTFGKGTTSFSNLSLPFARTDFWNNQSKPVEYVIEEPVSDTDIPELERPIVRIFQWFNVSVPGFVRPKSNSSTPSFDFDLWNKSITVSWIADENSTRSKNGTWSVYRGSTLVESGISYDTQYCEDTSNSLAYDTQYTYNIYFVPTNTPSGTSPRSELMKSCTAQLLRPDDFFNKSNTTATNNLDDKIIFSWSHTAIGNASGQNSYRLFVERSTDRTNWTEVKTIDITSPETTTGSYEDKSGLQAFTTYYYRAKINVLGKTYYSIIATGQLDGMSKVTSFTASRGTYTNVIKLKWDVNQVGSSTTYFTLSRRPIGSNDENDWAEITTISGTNASYSYDDVTAQVGTFNEYKIAVWAMNGQTRVQGLEMTTDGFCLAAGIISGQVTYGTGMAVDSVKVMLKRQSNGDETSGMHALKFTGANNGLVYKSDIDNLKNLLGGDFSVQAYLKPDNNATDGMNTNTALYQFFNAMGAFQFRLKYYTNYNNSYIPIINGTGSQWEEWASDIKLPANEWSHLTIVHKKDEHKVIVYKVQADTLISQEFDMEINFNSLSTGNLGITRNGDNSTPGRTYRGCIDEFRLFTKALTKDDILNNYNHPLAGNEDNLAIYYPLDEGIPSQPLAYDFSKKNGVANGRHATTSGGTATSIGSNPGDLPTDHQLSLMAYTDSIGNYTISGVPFSGEGVNYSIIPSLGIHEFSPIRQSRFVSANSLVHNSVNFEDVSSFPVSGKVFYAGTDYPVEGAFFYVDGNICAKDGEVIQTDKDGAYTISVPIGAHYIQIEKSGHEFANGGRYPADPNNTGTRYTFKKEIKNLEFLDETLVNFTGRVVGGDIQGKKSVGFGLSKNNIGVVKMVISPTSDYRMNVVKDEGEGTIDYVNNPNDVPIASATGAISSTSYRQGGTTVPDCQRIIILTDPETGEFSAMLPPLQYRVDSIKVKETGQIVGDPTTIDLTNANYVLSDTLYNEANDSYQLYEYNTMLKQTFHSGATFLVKQKGRDDGSFGIDSYKVTDELGEIVIDDIYSVNGGTVTYNYGVEDHHAPLFVQDDPYTFLIEGYEEYTHPITHEVDHVPLDGTVVTVFNALSSNQPVYYESVNGHAAGETDDLKSNQLVLDSEGTAAYKWKAGMPNIANPYTRTISITYDINGRTYPWSGNGMEGIILGSLPTGTNFVTAGPEKVSMVLRDPPGTNSFAEWKTGTTTTTSNVTGSTFSEDFTASFKHRFGFKKALVIGTGLATIEEIESVDDLEVGAKVQYENESSTSWVETTSITKTISTSAAPEYVGAQGDVYIGNSTNLLFGKVRNLDLRRQTGSTVGLDLKDIIETSLEFGTMFMYTQNYIENVMLPNYELMRKSMLQTVTKDEMDNFVNTTNHTVYLTTLPDTDPNFGQEDYKVFKSPNVAACQDSVAWINCQIDNWKNCIKDNEREKVKAYEKRSAYLLGDNISFDSGTTYNYETSIENDTTTTRDWKIAGGLVLDNSLGLAVDNFGFQIHVQDETIGGEHHVTDTTTVHTNTFSFTLAEEGDDDALTVDVYKYGNFGPIFRTLGGQTCCPYEGEVQTKYYSPGTTIMEATMQIEVPSIRVQIPTVSDVPTGSAANYTLLLSNASEIDEDVYYRLLVADETNPDGANLMIDGMPITDKRIIKIPAGETITKTLQLKQTDTSVLDFNDIALVLASQCQYDPTSTWDVITDTVFISAHFVPSSSEVRLDLSNTLMNTQTGTDLDLTFSGFDRNYHNLKAFRIEYKRQGNASWTKLKEYVLKSSQLEPGNSNVELLPTEGPSVTYRLPMASFSDGNYVFRVVSAATYGEGEVYRYSDEIALVKDMQRPRPLGQPSPTDGILDIGDELSVTFNEAFMKSELTKEKNFRVTGVLNGAAVAHETALSMQDTETTAQTEASIKLSDKPFSIDTWVNVSGAGTLLSHGVGSNKLSIGTDADGKLVVDIAGTIYTSSLALPLNTWDFLTLNYQPTDTGGELSASVAYDANTLTLFSAEPVVAYEGSGPLAVGKNMRGAIHELLLWDEAHDIATALLNRSVTKNPSTRHLIGYWKMNEGEGTTIRDYARNRHMTMEDETWYMDNENKAVNLDGQHYLMVEAGDLPIFNDDDYAVEFWMRGDSQTGEAQLLQMGDVALWTNAEGQLQLTGKGAFNESSGTVLSTSSGKVTNNAWHHIALNVLRQGAAAVYVDGQRVLSTNASNVGSIATDRLMMGTRRTTFSAGSEYSFDRPFTGQIDELRLWNATMTSDQLAANRKIRLTGHEDGLMAYFPFEIGSHDSSNQPITIGTENDITGSNHSATLSDTNGALSALSYTDEAPALRKKPVETNVSFNFTASDTKVVIEIDETPAAIAGATLNFTIRDVRDENGNYSMPTTWSAIVNQKELVWQEDQLSCTTTATNGTSVTATIVNRSGTQQMWTLEGMPTWLTASSEYGSTNPLEETQVTFNVSPSTPIGKYEETIYLKSNNGIETPLTINVKVTGDEPIWSFNMGDYEESMNIISSLYVLDLISEDEDDLVGAFIDGECRGLARPVFNGRYDKYFVTIDIYGNGDEDQKPIEFKVYDASTGTIYPVVNAYVDNSKQATVIAFEPDNLLGRFATPVILAATDEVEQNINLGKGWNWMSLAVKPNDFTLDNVFSKADGKVPFVKNKTGQAEYLGIGWLSDFETMNNREMYAVQTSEAFTLNVTGHKVKGDEESIALTNGWNWVAFNSLSVMSLDEALNNMDPQNDEIIKGQRGVAYYDGYEWAGSLKQLTPGQGYKIRSNGARPFTYPTRTAAGARRAQQWSDDSYPVLFTPVDYHNYPANMVLIAQVIIGGEPAEGVELGVFAGDECREADVTDARGMVYMTIPGDEPVELTFRVGDSAGIHEVSPYSTHVTYETDAVVGTPKAPFIINLGTTTGISDASRQNDNPDAVYDLQGRRVNGQWSTARSAEGRLQGKNGQRLRKGVYIVNGQKTVK